MLKRILIAEDDAMDAELAIDALCQYSLANQIQLVRDGAEALDYLYRRGAFAGEPPGNPAVMLLDLKMAKKNGIEVLREMKSAPNLRTIPVVVLTSSRESRDLKACYELGANAYVVKPVKFPEFVEAVKQIGVFWGLVNQPPPGVPVKA
jgi:two-component system response regulator